MLGWIKKLFSKLLKIFKLFVEEAFDTVSKQLIAEFKDFAVSTVKTLSTTSLSNEKKRNEAIKAIKDEAKARGKELSGSLINFIVELALQYVKKNL